MASARAGEGGAAAPGGEHGGATQRRVRLALAQVGGYWRPLAGVARLLEELGELAESLARPAAPGGELSCELADLWIITTVLADQFLGDVREPGGDPPAAVVASGGAALAELLARAGLIARIVNHYDGPKAPRAPAGWPSLSDAVAEFQRALAGVASAERVDLLRAVEEKLAVIPHRDAGRFARSTEDPSTAPCLERFRALHAAGIAGATQARPPRLWGACARGDASLAANAERLAPVLVSFTRAAAREGLDGLVIAGRSCAPPARPDAWVCELLAEVSRHDPARAGVARPSADALAGSSFTFNGVTMRVSEHPPRSERRSGRAVTADESFVVLGAQEDPAT